MANFVDSAVLAGGAGGNADVQDNCLMVRPKTRFEAAIERGDAYAWIAATADIDANDTVLLIENNETARKLYIEQIAVSTNASGQMVVFGCSGSTPATIAGAAVTAVNLNRASGRAALATAYTDETGQDQQAGSYPTLYYAPYVLASTTLQIPVGGKIALAPDHCIGIDVTAEPTGCTATVWGWFE